MREEPARWMEKAKRDIATARKNFEIAEYEAAAFFSQQAAEKSLKAVIISRKRRLMKIHDLVRLGREVSMPDDMLDEAKELTMAYIYSRYPDAMGSGDMKARASEFIDCARRIVSWSEKSL
jgi:HEPN domain-containing protein